jgi:aminomethyltransferase
MLKTPLYESHLKLNARIVDFGGWAMPVQYTNLIEEHLATRTKAGLFDICHMGEFWVNGVDAKAFLQYVLTNDLNHLSNNICFYSALCDTNGGTIDDLFVYQFNTDKYLLVVNAGTIEKDFTHLQTQAKNFRVLLEDKSDATAKLDLQGPNAEQILQKLVPADLKNLKRFQFIETTLLNTEVLISRTGYTGEDGFELYFANEKATAIWDELLTVGKIDGLVPVGLGARDTLRLEACYSLYGHELNEQITPIQAGIGFVVQPKANEFIGKNILLKQKQDGVLPRLIAFEMQEKAIPRDHYDIYRNGQQIGNVTSGTYSPTFKKGLGLGLINLALQPGDQIQIKIRDTLHPAQITQRPFYRYAAKK